MPLPSTIFQGPLVPADVAPDASLDAALGGKTPMLDALLRDSVAVLRQNVLEGLGPAPRLDRLGLSLSEETLVDTDTATEALRRYAPLVIGGPMTVRDLLELQDAGGSDAQREPVLPRGSESDSSAGASDAKPAAAPVAKDS